MTGSFCPGCGSPRKPGAKFCAKCGMRFDEKSTAEQAYKTAQEVSKTAKSIESTVSQAGAAIRTAGQVKDIVITPPAQWKVVIGDRLPGVMQAAADKAIDKVGEEAKAAVKAKMEDVVEGALSKTPPVPPSPRGSGGKPEAGTHLPARGATCHACGKPLKAGVKFCGSCGTVNAAVSVPAAPTCPHCGTPVRAGAKFCASCGNKI